jgi:hypothetical protein
MKTYPLQIEEIIWAEEGPRLYSRGHHPPSDFLMAIREHYAGVDGPVEQIWWRYLPSQEDYPHGLYIDALPHTRGAFPVTVVDL